MFHAAFKASLISAFLFLSACAYPSTTVEQGRGDASIYFTGAPEDAVAYVDGVPVGNAADFNGREQVLGVVPGRHRIEVRSGNTILLDQEIYVGAESRTALAIQ